MILRWRPPGTLYRRREALQVHHGFEGTVPLEKDLGGGILWGVFRQSR